MVCFLTYLITTSVITLYSVSFLNLSDVWNSLEGDLYQDIVITNLHHENALISASIDKDLKFLLFIIISQRLADLDGPDLYPSK